MSRPLRVLLADDSMVIRRILSQALSRHADLNVVGVARWGGEAVKLAGDLKPDVVLLDVEMPEMNGVEAAGRIRKLDRTLPIIMFSSLTVQGGNATFEALARGANDYVPKPSHVISLAESLQLIDSELVTKIRFWGHKRLRALQPESMGVVPSTPPGRRPESVQSLRASNVEVLVIGVSTGGPNALAEVLPSIPKSFPVPVLVVQHMPAVFTQLLAARLNQICSCPVSEAAHGEELAAGKILIAPGSYHMRIAVNNGIACAELDEGPAVNSCRPAVDVLFQSAATCYGSAVLAAVLTGMGKDGLDGCRAVKARGGRVLTQDQESSVVWGMPRAVAEAGLADQILPLSQIGKDLVRLVQKSSTRSVASC